MEDKCFKTHSELIEILKKRGMDFSDVDQEKKAISILEKENYYNVINGYKDLFLQKGTSTETYKKCAHDERFFDTKFKKAIHTKSIQNFPILNLPKGQSGYHAGINDVYAVAIMLALTLGKNDANQLCAEIKNEFTVLENELSTISIEDVKREMGFVGDWEKLKDL